MAMYDIVVAESTSPRDGKFVEKIGTYNPNTDPSTVVLKSDRAVYWLMVGAQPTDTARSVLSHEGVMYRKHLQVGVNKGAISQEQADEKYTTWKEDKQNRIAGAADTKTQTKEQSRAARLEAERKVSETRAEAIVKKNRVEEPVAEVVEDAPAAEATQEREVVNALPVAAVEEAQAGETPVELTADVVAPTEAAATEVTPAVEVPIADIVPADEVAAVEATVSEEAPAATEEAPAPAEETPVAETAPEADATPAPASEEAPATEVAGAETPTAEDAPAEETEKKDTPAAE